MLRRRLLLLSLCVVTACATESGVTVQHADRTRDPVSVPTEPSAPGTTDPQPPAGNGDGVGDTLFATLGDSGLDVQHYDIAVAYDPTTDELQGTVVMGIALTEQLSDITLDSAGPEIDDVTVDDVAATFRSDGEKLRITLPQPMARGDDLRVKVVYHLSPGPQTSPVGLNNGWFNTEGGSYVLNEPDAARTWLPCNDHPSDKALFDITVTVPKDLTAIANGDLIDHHSDGVHEVWHWRESRPMATYLMQVFTGDYELIKGAGPHGLPLLSAVLRSDVAAAQPSLDVIPDQIEFFEQYFGPYPLDRYGIAITDSYGGLAMETQERSYFSRDDLLGAGVQHMLLSHELAHQWFGDAVTPARWQDIWLNESFATYGQWLWLDHVGDGTVDGYAEQALANRQPGSTANPTVGEMFGSNSYDGGAVVLHALRLTIGDDAFFRLLQQWVADNNGRSVTTQDFVALAEKVSGQSLKDFFDSWLFAVQPPSQFPR